MIKTEWTLYIIQAANGHLYTGITTDLERRLKQHQNHSGGARFFIPVMLRKWCIRNSILIAAVPVVGKRQLRNSADNKN